MHVLRRLPILLAAAFLILGAAACGGSGKKSSSESEGGTTTIASMEAQNHGTKDVSNETGKVEVELDDTYFEPTVLKGKPGQKVTLELKNEGSQEHNFSVSDQQIDKDVPAGDEAEVDVTFPESGTLAFVCKFHQSSGMVGALEASS